MRSQIRSGHTLGRLTPGRLLLGLLAALVCIWPAAAGAQAQQQLRVSLKKSYLLDLGEVVETVSITDTDIADFVVAAKTQVLIHGKKEGATSLVVAARPPLRTTLRRGGVPAPEAAVPVGSGGS